MKLKNLLRSELFGPYPYFWEEKELRSSYCDKPEIHYYLWVKTKRCGDLILIKSDSSNKDFEALKEEWKQELAK